MTVPYTPNRWNKKQDVEIENKKDDENIVTQPKKGKKRTEEYLTFVRENNISTIGQNRAYRLVHVNGSCQCQTDR